MPKRPSKSVTKVELDRSLISSDTGQPVEEVPAKNSSIHQVISKGCGLLVVMQVSGLYLRLVHLVLEPLYNSIPLNAGTIYWTIPAWAIASLLSLSHRRTTSRGTRSTAVNVAVMAGIVFADVAALTGRRIGSICSVQLGTRWGAVIAQGAMSIGMVVPLAAVGSAVLETIFNPAGLHSGLITALRPVYCAATLALSMYCKRQWERSVGGGFTYDVQNPENAIVLLSTISLVYLIHNLTHTPGPPPSTRHKPTPAATSHRHRPYLTVLLCITQLGLCLFHINHHLHRPAVPYITLNGTLRILSSQRSTTGQIVVADDLERGFRFLRADASILGGRWFKDPVDVVRQQESPAMGDSIFATFPLQEIGLLARRDSTESIASTCPHLVDIIPSQVPDPSYTVRTDTLPTDQRALIIGLGVGIAASTFASRGIPVDIVEIDPLVYTAARDHFGLQELPEGSVSLMDGVAYVRDRAEAIRTREKQRSTGSDDAGRHKEAGMADRTRDDGKWDLVVQDCFSGGMVPGELFTVEFWDDVKVGIKRDGVVAVNFVGAQTSKPFRAVLRTLLSSFAQCRGFAESINMVVLCTLSYTPLLTFRQPRGDVRKWLTDANKADKRRRQITADGRGGAVDDRNERNDRNDHDDNDNNHDQDDYLGSPLRHHVYNTFYDREIVLEDLLNDEDLRDPEMILRKGKQKLGEWQMDIGISTSQEIQKLLSPEAWMTY